MIWSISSLCKSSDPLTDKGPIEGEKGGGGSFMLSKGPKL